MQIETKDIHPLCQKCLNKCVQHKVTVIIMCMNFREDRMKKELDNVRK